MFAQSSCRGWVSAKKMTDEKTHSTATRKEGSQPGQTASAAWPACLPARESTKYLSLPCYESRFCATKMIWGFRCSNVAVERDQIQPPPPAPPLEQLAHGLRHISPRRSQATLSLRRRQPHMKRQRHGMMTGRERGGVRGERGGGGGRRRTC